MLDIPFIRHTLIALATGIIIWGLSALLARTRPRLLDEGKGFVAPNRVVIALVTFAMLTIAGFAFWASLTVPGSFPAPIVGAAALLGGLLTATSFLPMYRVSWDEDGITGPTSLWPLPLGPKPGRILWEDIEAIGPDFGGGWFVEDDKGRRVRWNYIYSGYAFLMQEVETQCPWLFEPPLATPRI